MEHCAVELFENNSNMVYFKDEKMLVLHEIPANSEVICLLISIDYFHSLFSSEGNFLFNFNNFKVGQPIIEPKEISNTCKLILNQLTAKNVAESLQAIYTKGKIYELLSIYFSNITQENSDHCPYITNEEVVGKIKLAKEIVIKNMNNPPSLNDLAKEVGLNIKKLKSDFKEFYGVPVFTFLLNYKMELAKKLLQENKMNVNEISTHLGYSSSSHFIAAFKRKFGITPKQFSKS
ncbi:AraC family transcriptional regulator [Lutibacter sp. TH_r2]|uniref:helix-turn-helix transcriptional regulator n=1 Tax=Lutibacter sp. TH_r2 TaxID=3082083 RepID=UPI002954E2AB|nr:AraC family transcriptional regulator [Lutibacter sp. TH_r2]MDV7187122.1 AraC family transcriptional regulator [Lutibacter sp. TH_r2]